MNYSDRDLKRLFDEMKPSIRELERFLEMTGAPGRDLDEAIGAWRRSVQIDREGVATTIEEEIDLKRQRDRAFVAGVVAAASIRD